MPDTLTMILNSSPEGFLVMRKTLMHSWIKVFKRSLRVIEKGVLNAF